jgi:hypothetical protein
LKGLARPKRFELLTPRFVGGYWFKEFKGYSDSWVNSAA